MIVRPEGTTLAVIRQPDHARLALAILERWQPGQWTARPQAAAIRLAAREHDNGWTEEDADPQIDGDGRPLDFVAAPLSLKLRVWLRGIDRLAGADAYAAALVAQHAWTVYDQRRRDPAWAEFFSTIAARRDALLAGLDVTAAGLDADYAFVNLADALSLAFCTGAPPPRAVAGHQVDAAGGGLQVTPDPFDGAPPPLRVPARRIANRPYASAADLRSTLDAAPVEWVTGELR